MSSIPPIKPSFVNRLPPRIKMLILLLRLQDKLLTMGNGEKWITFNGENSSINSQILSNKTQNGLHISKPSIMESLYSSQKMKMCLFLLKSTDILLVRLIK